MFGLLLARLATLCIAASMPVQPELWRQVELPAQAQPFTSLASLAERPAAELLAASERVACFESTTGGLIQAALLTAPGAAAFTTCGAVSYTTSR